MLSIRKPSAERLHRFLTEQSKLDFTYSAVGATSGNLPDGYVVDHTRIKLGEGQQAYESAKAALRRWDQFRLRWLEAGPQETPIQVGAVVAVVARVMGLWWLNACRIIRVIDEPGPIHRFGFAYGTLPVHIGTGEERFLVEWDPSDDSVWYDVLAFSRPNHFLTRVGYPMVRRTQKRFARESSVVMQQAIRS